MSQFSFLGNSLGTSGNTIGMFFLEIIILISQRFKASSFKLQLQYCVQYYDLSSCTFL